MGMMDVIAANSAYEEWAKTVDLSDYSIKPEYSSRPVEDAPYSSYKKQGDNMEAPNEVYLKHEGVLTYDAWQRENLDSLYEQNDGYLDVDAEYDSYLYSFWGDGGNGDYHSALSSRLTTHRNNWEDRNMAMQENAAKLSARRAEMVIRDAERALNSKATSSTTTATRSSQTDSALTSGTSTGLNSGNNQTPVGSL